MSEANLHEFTSSYTRLSFASNNSGKTSGKEIVLSAGFSKIKGKI